MNYKHFIVFSFLAMSLSGCISAPRTADAIVQSAKKGKMFTAKQEFEVDRSLAEVTHILKMRSHQCLRTGISFAAAGDTSGGIRMDKEVSRQLTPKLFASAKHTRLTVQVKATDGTKELGGMPRDGWYMLVVDAYPANHHKTRVENYYQQTSFREVFNAIKPWLTGSKKDCPDLTK